MLRALGVDFVVVVDSEFAINPLDRGCWDGGPRFGRGPEEGMRRDAAPPPGARICAAGARDGGGINWDAGLPGAVDCGLVDNVAMDVGFGGGGMGDARCALLGAGKIAFGNSALGSASSLSPSSMLPLEREKLGTVEPS